jgi:FkbM family methyltransferase
MSAMRAIAGPIVRAAIRAAGKTTDVRRFNGTALRVPPRAAAHVPPFVNLNYDPLEWRAIDAFGRAGGTFIDVGANIGVMSALMSRVAGPGGCVIAAEPQPKIYSALVELIEANGLTNVTPIQALLLDHCGVADLNVSAATPLGVGSSWRDHEGGATERIAVPAITLDALAASRSAVDYVKIDAEGAEGVILAGAAKTLARCRPIVQVEMHGQYMMDAEREIHDLFSLMISCDYAAVNLATGRQTDAAAFLADTGHHVVDPATHEDLALRGYGQMVFTPCEHPELLSAASTVARGNTIVHFS